MRSGPHFTEINQLMRAKDEPAKERYVAEDHIFCNQSGQIVPADDATAQHVFLAPGETCPLALARSLHLPGADAQDGSGGKIEPPAEEEKKPADESKPQE